MKRNILLLLVVTFSLLSCRKYLDINSDPDTPQNPDPTSVFPVILSNIPGGGGERGTGGVQSDALWIGSYIQFWHARVGSSATVAQHDWDLHGYNAFTGDRAAGIWRLTYFGAGNNLEYCIEKGLEKGQWDVVGATLALKAYLFQLTTNYHGDIIYNDAFKKDSLFFKWDDQSVVYRGVDSLCRLAINYLSRTDYPVTAQRLSRGDFVYNGDVSKWARFTYGILARNFSAPIRKDIRYADSVLKYTDLSLTSFSDDFLIPFDATRNADANWFGPFRNNLPNLRQSDYIIRLLDGRVFSGSNTFNNRDPRIRHMLSASADTTNGNGGYRGAIPGSGDPNNAAANQRVRSSLLWYDSTNARLGATLSDPGGKYLFHNKAVFPIMTYSEIQFMKAEAALYKMNTATAHDAYLKGIRGHFDFINRASFPRGNVPLYNQTPITTTQRDAYLLGPNVKQTPAALKLSDVMQQKFIALWGWGFVETWTDMRKYHYTDVDPVTSTGTPVYSGMVMPATLFADNSGKYAYRVRPRYNSEYVWNIYLSPDANRIDYHTIETWFSKP